MTPGFKLRLRHAISAAAIALAAGVASGAAPEAAFESAFKNFIVAAAGDKSTIEPAAEQFEVLLNVDPSNPVLMAYAGASTAMRAGTTMLPWKKMSYAEDGLAMIDKALALLVPAHDAPIQHGTPGSLEVRFIAANSFLAVPGFMNRGARGAKLLHEVLTNPLFAKAPLPFQGNVWMRAALLATQEKRGDDARRYLNEVIAHNAPQAEKARALLNGPAV